MMDEYAGGSGANKDSKDIRKKKMLKRIHEYEKFLANCNRLKAIDKEKREKLQKKRRHTILEGMHTEPMFSVLIRSKSLSYLEIIQTNEDTKKTDRFSLPPLPDYDSTLNLEDKILLWQSCGGPYPRAAWTRVISLSYFAEETMEEEQIRRGRTRFKSLVFCIILIVKIRQVID